MSDENILVTNGNWNFYLRPNDFNFVYLSFYVGYNDVPFGTNIAIDAPVEIRIPIDAWREIISKWQGTEWGKNLDLDHTSKTLGKVMKEIINSKKS
tara:strand:+ start:106 stop:393 length:288 start_codon:yes stop_codon:yes gene_type:complete